MAHGAAIEAVHVSTVSASAAGAREGDPGLAPAPGDGGTPVLERQNPGWANAANDKKGATKRLARRLKRRVVNSDIVRKLKRRGAGSKGSKDSFDSSDSESVGSSTRASDASTIVSR